MMTLYTAGSALPFRMDQDPEDYLAFIKPLMTRLVAGEPMGTVGYIVLLRTAAAALFYSGQEYEAREYLIAVHVEERLSESIANTN